MKFRTLVVAAALALAGCNDTSALEGRVQELEDQIAIQRLITDYSAYLDARDYDGYVGLFTAEGVWANGETRREGQDEIRDMLTGLFGDVPDDFVNTSSFHQISNFEIDVDGDEATARSRFIFVMRGEGGAPTNELSGQYHDRLVRTGDGWKIAERVDHTVMPTPEEWVAEVESWGANTLED